MNDEEFYCSFTVMKHSWRGKYFRVISFGSHKLVTMDLKSLLRITNSWDTSSSIVSILPDPSNSLTFTVSSQNGGKQSIMFFSCFRSQERMELLTSAHRERRLSECSSSYSAQKYCLGNVYVPTTLRVTRISMDEVTENGAKVRQFLFMHIKGYTSIIGEPTKLIIAYGSQLQLFLFQVDEVKKLLDFINANTEKYIGISPLEKMSPMTQEQFDSDRIGFRNDLLESVAEFSVTAKDGVDHSVSPRLLCVTHSAIVEREVENYTTTRATLLLNIHSLVRCHDDDQQFLIEYKEPHVVHTFVSPMRDAILGHICSVARLCQNNEICIISKLQPRFMRFGTLRYPILDEVETSLLYYVAHPEKLEGVSSPSITLAVDYFNANVSYSGLRFSENKDGFFSENREGAIQDALRSVVLNYPQYNQPEVLTNRFSCLRRLCLTRAGFAMVATSGSLFSAISQIIMSGLRHDSHAVHKEVVDFISVLVVSHHEHYELRHEITNKTNILSVKGLLKCLMKIFNRLIYDESQITVLQSLLAFFVSIMCYPFSESTPASLFANAFDQLVDKAGKKFFWLLDSSCIDIQINAARLLRAMIEEGNETQFHMLQAASISEGGFLHQFHVAVFSKNMEQRDLARCLISYWAYNNTKIHDLMRRMIPISLLLLLQSKETAEKDEQEKSARRTYEEATDEYREKRKSWIEKALKQTPIRREDPVEPPVILRVRNVRVRPSLNWPLLFSCLKKDYRRPDLIWNHATRTELRQSIENELSFLKANASQRSHETKVAWNYLEFEVSYPSLQTEVKIGDHYPRLLFESTEPKISRPKEFFQDLYHRFLLATEGKEKVFCLQGMTILLRHYGEVIGYFHDIPFFVSMLRDTMEPLLRDSLIDFFFSLLDARHNIKGFIDSEGPAVLAELLPLAHLHIDRPKSYAATNAIEQGKKDTEDSQSTEKEWYYSIGEERKGPYSYTEMKRYFEEGTISSSTTVWAQGLSGWKAMKDVPQMRWGIMCATLPAVFTLSELSSKILDIFLKLCIFYPSTDEDGAVMSPLPKIKRMLSSSIILPHIVQLLLTFDSGICSRVQILLFDLMDHNPIIARFHSSGVFFFSLMYNGADILPMTKLLRSSHRQQSYKYLESSNEVVQSSILAPLLPPAMICALTHNEPEDFVKIFLGESESPEVMWGSSMRHFMMAKIAAHLADFTPRLLGNIHVVYQYCPIGKIEYETLKNELFCHEYYLRLLCDTSRFSDWKIRDPVGFLVELLQQWKLELTKEPCSMSVASCCTELELECDGQNVPSSDVIRHAYLKLLPKYHPDKNPDGREKFEMIQKAYEFLVSERHGSEQTTRENLQLILKTQTILYQRCGEELASFKYAGFRSLLQLLQQELEDPAMFRKETLLVDAATELCHATVANISLNADELQVEGGIPVIATLLRRSFEQITPGSTDTSIHVRVATHCTAIIAVAGQLEDCRTLISKDKGIESLIVKGLNLQKAVLLLKNCVWATGVLAMDEKMQQQLIHYGAMWFLLRLIFSFDVTVENAGVELQEERHTQMLSNAAAIAALKALLRLADPSTSSNSCSSQMVQRWLDLLLTPFISKRMTKDPNSEKDILQLLTTNTDHPYFLWNNSTRSELLNFVENRCEHFQSGDIDESLNVPLDTFEYSAHKGALCIDGVYIQSFLSQPKHPLEDPHHLFLAMCHYTDEYMLSTEENTKKKDSNILAVVRAMKLVLHSSPAQGMSAACTSVKSLLSLLKCNNTNILLEILDLHEEAFTSQEYISAVEQTALFSSSIGCLLGHPAPQISEKSLSVVQLGLSNRGIVEQSLQQRLYVLILRVCLRDSSTQIQKERSAHCLSISFSDKLIGPQVYHACSAFLPKVFLDSMKEKWVSTAQLLSTWQDNPELYWTEEKKKRVEEALEKMSATILKRMAHHDESEWPLEDRFPKLEGSNLSDVVVGGVFLKSYEQNPGWQVRNPKDFAVALLERFLMETQQPMINDALIVLVTAAAMQLLGKSPHLRDSVAPLGYTAKIMGLFASPYGSVFTAALQWINALGRSKRSVETLSKNHVIKALMQFITDHPQHSFLWLQTVEGIVAHSTENCSILQQALDFHLVEYLLQSLSDTTGQQDLKDDPAVIRALIIRIIKTLQSLPEPLYLSSLATLLNDDNVWKKYKDHSHDLFLGNAVSNSGNLLTTNATAPTLFLEAPQLFSSEPPAVP